MALAIALNRQTLQIAGATILPNVGGWLNGVLVTRPNILNGWYGSLQKPAYNPPNWLFAPAWTSIYSAMGYASYLVWSEQEHDLRVAALAVYGVQLAVNHSWTPVFFGLHDLQNSFYVIVGLDALAALNAALFYKVQPAAGLLLAPYLLWLGYASYLNYSLWQLNKGKASKAPAAGSPPTATELNDDDTAPITEAAQPNTAQSNAVAAELAPKKND